MEKLRACHQGARAFLVGSGPSVADAATALRLRPPDVLAFGNNLSIADRRFELDYFLMSDPKMWHHHAEALRNNSVRRAKFTTFVGSRVGVDDTHFTNAHGLTHLPCGARNVLLPEFTGARIEGSSIFITLQLMLYMGVRTIHVVGCDCDRSVNTYKGSPVDYRFLINGWRDARDITRRHYPDVTLRVVNPIGLRSVLPPTSPRDAFTLSESA